MDIDITLQQPFTHAVVVESDMSAVTYNLGPVALIPFGEGRMFEVGDTTIAVFRVRGGQVYATEPWCPHRGGPLADGIVASGKVVCPLHGYMFELETGNPVHHECRKLRTFPVRLNDADELLVTMRRKDKPRVAEATPAEQTAAECEAVAEDGSEPVAIDG
jgi:nitrite reductase (NADH) small subunit